MVQKNKPQGGEQEGPQNHNSTEVKSRLTHAHEPWRRGCWWGIPGVHTNLDNHGRGQMGVGFEPEPTYLVLGVEDNSLGVGHTDHVVVKASSGQPDSGRELMVEQGEL